MYRAWPWNSNFLNEAGSSSGMASQVKGSSLGLSLLLTCCWVPYIPDSQGVSCHDPARGQRQSED